MSAWAYDNLVSNNNKKKKGEAIYVLDITHFSNVCSIPQELVLFDIYAYVFYTKNNLYMNRDKNE